MIGPETTSTSEAKHTRGRPRSVFSRKFVEKPVRRSGKALGVLLSINPQRQTQVSHQSIPPIPFLFSTWGRSRNSTKPRILKSRSVIRRGQRKGVSYGPLKISSPCQPKSFLQHSRQNTRIARGRIIPSHVC